MRLCSMRISTRNCGNRKLMLLADLLEALLDAVRRGQYGRAYRAPFQRARDLAQAAQFRSKLHLVVAVGLREGVQYLLECTRRASQLFPKRAQVFRRLIAIVAEQAAKRGAALGPGLPAAPTPPRRREQSDTGDAER